MVYDAARAEIALFGGVFFPTTYNDTWTWDGSNWQRESPPASPPARAYLAMAYDEVRGEAVMFGGNNIPTYLNDTWVWDGTTWAQRFPATSPSARALPGMTYDAARGRVVLFGGQEADGTPLGDTWTLGRRNLGIAGRHGQPQPPQRGLETDSSLGHVRYSVAAYRQSRSRMPQREEQNDRHDV